MSGDLTKRPREEEGDVNWDAVYLTLASAPRRAILSRVRGSPGPTSVDELATLLVEGGYRPTSDWARARVDLYHVHLPKLSEAALVDWNGIDEVGPSTLSHRLPTELVSPRIVATPSSVRSETD